MSYSDFSEKLLALAIALSSLELLMIRHWWNDSGTWAWKTIQKDLSGFPLLVRIFLSAFLNAKVFSVLLFLSLFGGIYLLAFRGDAPGDTAILGLFFSVQWLTSIRFRGTFNGGSDSMIVICSLGLFLASVFSESILLERIAYAGIAAQLVLSYFMPGVTKLKNEDWRKGTALQKFTETPGYNRAPAWFIKILRVPPLSRGISICVIGFECTFPLALISGNICLAFLSVALIFHLLNFLIFGLNRFVWAWLPAYPILYFWAERSGV